MAHDTDASNSTSTTTKSHIIPLNNHFNKRKEIESLMAPLASCARKHVIVM